jgi:hypothetical protein
MVQARVAGHSGSSRYYQKAKKRKGDYTMKRKEILDTATKCVCGDREQDYGSPENNFATIAALWEPYLKRKCVSPNADVCVLPEDVGILLALMKIGRIASGNVKEDNYIDLAGYAACAGEIETDKHKQRKVAGSPSARYFCVFCGNFKDGSCRVDPEKCFFPEDYSQPSYWIPKGEI